MKKLQFYYEKAPTHQEVLVDGAVGSTVQVGSRLAVSFYTERAAIPKVVVYEIDEDGSLGNEISEEREGKEGVVRIVMATLHLELERAETLHQWLGEQIERLRKEGEDESGTGGDS